MNDHQPLIQPYRDHWARDFVIIKTVIEEVLSDKTSIAIEHVGSTAVPGLAAKPIIDIDIVHGTEAFPIIKNGLETLGYFHNGNQGIPDREVFKRNRTLSPHPVLDSIQHHLYVCPDFSEELKKHLLFRNYLRGHAEARKHYETIKIQLAKEARQDRKVYAMLKEEKASDFIASTLSKARKESFT